MASLIIAASTGKVVIGVAVLIAILAFRFMMIKRGR
jgi:hypothetical protein